MIGDTAAAPVPARSQLRFGLRIALLVILLDQASKWWILGLLQGRAPPVIEILPVFNLVLTWNRGVSFGMFSSAHDIMPYVLVAVALAISGGLLLWMRKVDRLLLALPLGLVVGGALGNVVDRLRYGAVVDFLDVHVGGWHWPAFNVADSAITIGVLAIVADGLFAGRDRG
jgi:signal peptidase II